MAILIVNRLACRARRVRRAQSCARPGEAINSSLHTRPYTTLVLVAGLGFLVGRAGVVERACDDRGLAAPHQACGQSAGHEPYTLWGVVAAVATDVTLTFLTIAVFVWRQKR